MRISRLVDDLKEIINFDFGYTYSKYDEIDPSKQIERIRNEEKQTLIANRRYSVAKKRLDRYMFRVSTSLRNGFQKLPEPNQEVIFKKLECKLRKFASSTGLCRAKINELTKDYILKIERLYCFYRHLGEKKPELNPNST